MNILFDEEQLRRLIANLKILTGLPANILDPDGRDINLFRGHPPFCRMINDLPEGHERCINCDMWKIRSYTAEKGFQFYRCHLGICEAVMPLYDRENPLAYLAVGCYLDDSPVEEQWARTRDLLGDAHWPDQAVYSGKGAVRRKDPVLSHRPAADQRRQTDADAEQSAHLRRGRSGGHQRL